MKKYVISFLLAVSYFFYVFFQRNTQNPDLLPANTSINSSDTTAISPTPVDNTPPVTSTPSPPPTPAPTPTPTPTPPPVPTPKPKPTGQYNDGTYTGQTADAFYGLMQVEAIISGGRLTDIKFLQYPNDNNHSQRINSQALPLLRSEAIQAQSANVDAISGASASSQAFQLSLASALSQAK